MPDHALAFDDRQPGDLVRARQIEHVAHGHARRDGDRVFDDSALEALDLGRPRPPAPWAACSCAGCRCRLPGRARWPGATSVTVSMAADTSGKIELDGARQPGLQADFTRQDAGMGGNQQRHRRRSGPFERTRMLMILRKKSIIREGSARSSCMAQCTRPGRASALWHPKRRSVARLDLIMKGIFVALTWLGGDRAWRR